MKTVFFEDGTIIMCARQCELRRVIRTYLHYNGAMRYWFRPCEAWRDASAVNLI